MKNIGRIADISAIFVGIALAVILVVVGGFLGYKKVMHNQLISTHKKNTQLAAENYKQCMEKPPTTYNMDGELAKKYGLDQTPITVGPSCSLQAQAPVPDYWDFRKY